MKYFLVVIILVSSWIHSLAQDMHFSQLNATPLLLNPAMAGGLHHDLEARMNYRNQWNAVASPYRTMGASADVRLKPQFSKDGFWSFGINFMKDESGSDRINTTITNLSFAYHLFLDKRNTIGFAVQPGINQRSIDQSGFQWGSQFDNGEYNNNLVSGEYFEYNQFNRLDISAGMVWSFNDASGYSKVTSNNHKLGTTGFAVHHINRPDYSFNKSSDLLSLRYVLHGNYLLSLSNSKFAINPSFMLAKQGPNREIYFGSTVRYDLIAQSKYTGAFNGGAVYGGIYYRWNDAIVLMGQFEISEYAIGLSYDINTSSLRTASSGRGGFEMSLRYTNRKIHRKNYAR